MSKKNITSFELNPANPPKMSKADLERLDAKGDEDIDYSEIPELTDDFWRYAKVLMPQHKSMVAMRVDDDILEFFRKEGKGYQSRINAVLRAYVEAQRH